MAPRLLQKRQVNLMSETREEISKSLHQRKQLYRLIMPALASGAMLGLSGPAQADVTGLTANPASPQVVGTNVTFTATVQNPPSDACGGMGEPTCDAFVTFFADATFGDAMNPCTPTVGAPLPNCNIIPVVGPAVTVNCLPDDLAVGEHTIQACSFQSTMDGNGSMPNGVPFELMYTITDAPPPPANATAIPTVGASGLALMGLMLSGLAWRGSRRKKD